MYDESHYGFMENEMHRLYVYYRCDMGLKLTNVQFVY